MDTILREQLLLLIHTVNHHGSLLARITAHPHCQISRKLLSLSPHLVRSFENQINLWYVDFINTSLISGIIIIDKVMAEALLNGPTTSIY